MGKHKVYGVVYLPSDFDTRLNRMEQAHVSVYCNMGLMLTYKAIFQTCTAVAADINSGIQIRLSGNKTNREDELTTAPLSITDVPMFNNTSGYGNFILPAVLVLILQQILLLGIGITYGTASCAYDRCSTAVSDWLASWSDARWVSLCSSCSLQLG